MEGLDGLVIPGGESTTIGKLIASAGLEPALAGTPRGGSADPRHLRRDDRLRRRAPRLHRRDREAQRLRPPAAELRGRPRGEGVGDEPLRAVFIRAPWVERHGPGVEVLASYEGHPVAIREGTVLACSFHPELTDDPRFHAIFMAMTTAARERAGEEARR